jgi:hypothetical protein
MPPWCGAQLKHRNTFTLPLPEVLRSSIPCSSAIFKSQTVRFIIIQNLFSYFFICITILCCPYKEADTWLIVKYLNSDLVLVSVL